MNSKRNTDGVLLCGLGELTLNDVFNDPNGLDYVLIDSEYYYVFPKYKSGYCGDAFWMVNKKDINKVSTTSITALFDTPKVLERLDTLKRINIDEWKRGL